MLVDMKPELAAVMHMQASTRTAIYGPMERSERARVSAVPLVETDWKRTVMSKRRSENRARGESSDIEPRRWTRIRMF